MHAIQTQLGCSHQSLNTVPLMCANMQLGAIINPWSAGPVVMDSSCPTGRQSGICDIQAWPSRLAVHGASPEPQAWMLTQGWLSRCHACTDWCVDCLIDRFIDCLICPLADVTMPCSVSYRTN